MNAAIFDAPHTLRYGEWSTPKPGPHEVVVAVKAAGICAGDMHIYQGRNPYAAYPIIGGHEICGTIAEVGSAVRGIGIGRLVVLDPFMGCGTCYPCRIGKANCCANLRIIGVHQAGGFADCVIGPAKNVHLVPAGLSPTWASFAEPVTIGVQACRRGAVKTGEYVLILGTGSIGLALSEVARARGAHPVVTDINDARLEFARSLGAKTLRADDQLLQNVLDQTNGEGAPVVIEATGSVKAMEQTVDLVAAGGRIVIVGLVRHGTMIQFSGLDFTRKEMTIVGSSASVNCFPEALELLARGKIQHSKVATEFPLTDAPAAFEKLNRDPEAMLKGVFVRA